jgi:hypothetical protein
VEEQAPAGANVAVDVGHVAASHQLLLGVINFDSI